MGLMSSKEAAAYLRVSVQHIRNLANGGVLSVYSPHPRRFYFKKEWLDEYLEARTRKGA